MPARYNTHFYADQTKRAFAVGMRRGDKYTQLLTGVARRIEQDSRRNGPPNARTSFAVMTLHVDQKGTPSARWFRELPHGIVTQSPWGSLHHRAEFKGPEAVSRVLREHSEAIAVPTHMLDHPEILLETQRHQRFTIELGR